MDKFQDMVWKLYGKKWTDKRTIHMLMIYYVTLSLLFLPFSLASFLLFFLPSFFLDLFYLSERQSYIHTNTQTKGWEREKEKERESAHSPNGCNGWTRLSQAKAGGLEFHYNLPQGRQECQYSGHLEAVTGSWITRRAGRTWTSTHKGCLHPWQQLVPSFFRYNKNEQWRTNKQPKLY